MKKNITWIAVILLSLFVTSCGDKKKEVKAPQITAQGFVIEETQQGVIGKFAPLRLRIESEGRIQQLRIQERSYDIDLATTPERDHFSLFGLNKKAHLRQDITLDFQNYINQKLTSTGDYQFDIEVADKYGASTKVQLKIRINSDPAITPPVETGEFKLLREGKGDVKEGVPFGVTWKTVDANRVTIQISKVNDGASKLVPFAFEDYRKLSDKPQLARWINDAKGVEVVEFPTAVDDAYHKVFGIENLGKYYLLCVCKSKTDLSDIGTTVYLKGEYKY